MNQKLCADGWPQVVVSLNCFVRDAKESHEQLQDKLEEAVKALHEIYEAGQKGYGTTAECEVVSLAEIALQKI